MKEYRRKCASTFLLTILILLLFIAEAPAQSTPQAFNENFDSTAGTSLPAGWTASGFTISTTSPRSSPHCASATGNTTTKILASSTFDFTGVMPSELIFYERRSSTATTYRLEVRFVSGSQEATPLAQFDSISTSSSYVRRQVSLPETLAGATSVRFEWVLNGDGTSSSGVLRLDDISILTSIVHDLSLSALRGIPPLPSRTDRLILSATIHNPGRSQAENWSVQFLEDVNRDGLFEESELLQSVGGTPLSPADSTVVEINLPPQPGSTRKFLSQIAWDPDECRTNDTATLSIAVGGARGDVLVNEILYAPAGDEPEWVELLNASPDTVDMKNWRISDNNTSSRALISGRRTKFAPGDYMIVARDSSFSTFHADVSVPVVFASFSALNNTTPDAVVVTDDRGFVMDSVAYTPAWGGQNGKSLERIAPEWGSDLPENWKSSRDSSGSTPGRLNSIARLDTDLWTVRAWISSTSTDANTTSVLGTVRNNGRLPIHGFRAEVLSQIDGRSLASADYPTILNPLDSMEVSLAVDSTSAGRLKIFLRCSYTGDQRSSNDTAGVDLLSPFEPMSLVISEVMFDPHPGKCEWVEFLNRAENDIPVAGWSVSDAPTFSGSVNRTVLPDRVVPSGGFLVVAADSSIFCDLSLPLEFPIVVCRASEGLGLNNDGDAIILRDLTGRTIDSVFYSPDWHHPAAGDTRGKSIERIAPSLPSNDSRNWNTSTSPSGGTPGKPNSIRLDSHGATGRLTISPNPFSPDADGFEDFCLIEYRLPFTSSIVNVKVFDLAGRLVRWLGNTVYTGADARMIWDGRDDRGQRVRVGGYIVLLQATSQPAGETVSCKALVAVAAKF